MLITKNNGVQKGAYRLSICDLDKEAELDLRTGKGMIITEPIKDKKSSDNTYNKGGIRSDFFYSEMHTDNAFKERYSCKCGHLMGKSYESALCPYCRTPVKLVDIDLQKFGYIVLKDYRIIHPQLYMFLDNIFGTKNKKSVLENIMRIPKHKDTGVDGNVVKDANNEDDDQFKDQPFARIGMLEFQKRFDEIFEYYVNKNKRNVNMQGNAEFVRQNKDKLFIKYIPVFSSALRFSVIQDEINFVHGADKIYNILFSTVSSLNKTKGVSMSVNKKLAYIQKQMQELYAKMFSLLNKKDGFIKSGVIAGKMNFTGRHVIISNPDLAADEIIVPYMSFLEEYKFEIIHILSETQNITESQAYDEWYQGCISFSNKIYEIMKTIIAKGAYYGINRPPTIDHGSVLLQRIVDVTHEIDDLTMSISFMILPGLNADFDGDNLTVMKLSGKDQINDWVRFNPRKYMMISHDHGLLNENMLPIKDLAIGISEFNKI